MYEKVYLPLLILCGILCQGIIATPDEDTRESPDVLVRNRRVVSHLQGGLTELKIKYANYLVTIKERDRTNCVGSILTRNVVITTALCVKLHPSQYQVLSGSSVPKSSTTHNVTLKKEHYGPRPFQEHDGIALITVTPPFVYSKKTGHIYLHIGPPIPAGTHVTVYGWGCVFIGQVRPMRGIQRALRSINLPIMPLHECQNTYKRNYDSVHLQSEFAITDKHMCTYHPQQYCAGNDEGAPLVINNTLAGIHVWKGAFVGKENPDVFINLNRFDYAQWIVDNTR